MLATASKWSMCFFILRDLSPVRAAIEHAKWRSAFLIHQSYYQLTVVALNKCTWKIQKLAVPSQDRKWWRKARDNRSSPCHWRKSYIEVHDDWNALIYKTYLAKYLQFGFSHPLDFWWHFESTFSWAKATETQHQLRKKEKKKCSKFCMYLAYSNQWEKYTVFL